MSFNVVDLFTETSSFSDHLQEAQVLALSQDACIDYYSHTGYEIYDDMMCAGHNNDIYTGACYVSLSKYISLNKGENLASWILEKTTKKNPYVPILCS